MSDPVARVLNEQKGEILMLRCLSIAILRALDLDARALARNEFDIEYEAARTVMLNSSAPEEVLQSFDLHVGAVNALWVVPPRS